MGAMDNRRSATQYYVCWVVDFDHEERLHQGLGSEFIAPTTTVSGTGPIRCRERLGGLLKFSYREAA